MPPDVQGNMAAVSAEGNGDRFVVIALETSKPLPVNDPGKDCTRSHSPGTRCAAASRSSTRRSIDGTHTWACIASCRRPGRRLRTGELYDYSAQFGDYQVIVIANPLVVPDQPVATVDTQRARDLLVKAVAAIRT